MFFSPISFLAGGFKPYKNMSSSIGMMKFPTEWIKVMFQTTNQCLFTQITYYFCPNWMDKSHSTNLIPNWMDKTCSINIHQPPTSFCFQIFQAPPLLPAQTWPSPVLLRPATNCAARARRPRSRWSRRWQALEPAGGWNLLGVATIAGDTKNEGWIGVNCYTSSGKLKSQKLQAVPTKYTSGMLWGPEHWDFGFVGPGRLFKNTSWYLECGIQSYLVGGMYLR